MVDDSRATVIYHAGCADGFTAAWIAHGVMPDAELIPAHYGSLPPWDSIDGQRVFILDFSYSREVIEDIHERAKSLLVIDHHATARDALAGLDYCVFKMESSGAMLAWRHFRDGAPPHLVNYVEDRDLWRWELHRSREYNAAIRSYPFDLKTWDILSTQLPSLLMNQGEAILREQEKQVRGAVSAAVPISLAGHDVRIVNTTVHQSEIGGSLAHGAPFGATYMIVGDEVVVSLRSRDGGVDVSDVARVFGGGGHVAAAGFRVPAGVMVDALKSGVLATPEGENGANVAQPDETGYRNE